MKNLSFIFCILLFFSCTNKNFDFISIIIEKEKCLAMTKNGKILFESEKGKSDIVINKAIMQLEKDGVIFLNIGTYLLTDAIFLKSDIKLIGDVDYLTILSGNLNSIIKGDSVKNVTISNITVEGTKGGSSKYDAILFEGLSIGNVIQKVIVKEANGAGVRFLGKDCQNNTVANCMVTDCRGGEGIGFGHGAGKSVINKNKVSRTLYHGIVIWEGGSNCTISNNYIEESGFYRPNVPEDFFCHGIAIDGGAGKNPGKNHLITGNTIFNSGAAGIEVADGIDSVIIRENNIHGTGKKAPWDQYGIYFGGSYKPGIYAEIVGNQVSNCKWCGIRVDSNRGENGYTTDVRIDSNFVSNISRDGILVGTTKNIKVRNNKIQNTQGNGIRIEGLKNMHAENIFVSNNEITETQKFGIYMDNTDNGIIQQNQLSNNQKGKIFRNR